MQIHVDRGGQRFGPYSIEDVNRYIADGTLLPSDIGWHEGAADWVPLAQITGVNAGEREPAPPTPPTPPILPAPTGPPAPTAVGAAQLEAPQPTRGMSTGGIIAIVAGVLVVVVGLIVVGVIMLAGKSDGGGGSSMEVFGKDGLREKLIGSWEVRETDQPEDNVIYVVEGIEEFFDNGRDQLNGTCTIESGQELLLFKVMMTGTWEIKGDILTQVIEDAKWLPQNAQARQAAEKVDFNELIPKGQTTQQRIVEVNDDVLVREDLDGENLQTGTRVR